MRARARPCGASPRSGLPWPRSRQELLLSLRGVRSLRSSGLLQRLDLLSRVAALRQDLGRMLAEGRSRALDACRSAGELDREAKLLDLAHLGLLVGDHHLPLPDELG